jgi:hypothetical protein
MIVYHIWSDNVDMEKKYQVLSVDFALYLKNVYYLLTLKCMPITLSI